MSLCNYGPDFVLVSSIRDIVYTQIQKSKNKSKAFSNIRKRIRTVQCHRHGQELRQNGALLGITRKVTGKQYSATPNAQMPMRYHYPHQIRDKMYLIVVKTGITACCRIKIIIISWYDRIVICFSFWTYTCKTLMFLFKWISVTWDKGTVGQWRSCIMRYP